jgi:hypothetical protein
MKLKNSALQELYDRLLCAGVSISPYAKLSIREAFEECDEKLSESITFAHIKDLQDRNDILEESNKSLLAGNLNLSTEKHYLKNQISRLEELLLDANTTLEKANADRTEPQEAVDKLSGENGRLNARVEWLREEVNRYRKRYKEQSDKINELTKNYQDLSIKLKWCQTNVGRESRFLWDMLQEVSDYYYFGCDDEFDIDDCEMTSMTDIIDILNVDQFLEAYKNWHKAQEQHRLDHMRDCLRDFCANRFCKGCPLASNEYKCGRGYSFTGAHPIPDEDIKRYYEKAIACSKPMCHFERECTLEGTINAEINKDLLNKVFGIDSDD